VRPGRKADNSTVQVVPNVKVRLEAQHSILPLSLNDLLRKPLPLAIEKCLSNYNKQAVSVSSRSSLYIAVREKWGSYVVANCAHNI
jgi:predicted metal-dependent hydrolase